jgi:diacylglycerol kinase family enzyme
MYLSDLKVLVIYNPMAGKGKIKRLMPQVKSMYEKAGLKPLFHATKCRDDAYRIAKAFIKKFYNAVKPEADDRKHSLYVIAAGGDGTLNEVMRGVLDTGCDVPIGIIPAGSTNDFGYSLGINNGMLDAAEKALNAILMDEAFKCDVATFNGKYITYTSAFGLFSDVSYATPQNFKNRFGHSAYIMYGAKNILKTRKIHTRIMYKDDKILRSAQDDNQGDLDTVDVNDGQECTGNSWKTIEGDMLLGMVVSAKSVGGFRGITGSGVELDDGKNELLFVKWPDNPIKLAKTIGHAIGMVRKSPKAREKALDMTVENGIKIIRVKEAKFIFDKPVAWALDGEDGGSQTEDIIKVKKQAVSYLVV